MNCERCQEQLIDYLYRELEREPRQAIAQHLGSCSRCAIEYCRLDADLSGIAASFDDAPSAGVARSLRAKVEAAFPRRTGRRLGELLTLRVALYQPLLLLAAVLCAWLLYSGYQDAPRASNGSTTIEGYDGRTIVTVDPRVL